VTLVAHGERVDSFGNYFGTQILQAFNQFLGGPGIGIGLADQLADQLIGTKAAKDTHARILMYAALTGADLPL
jgi:hypothetical protein